MACKCNGVISLKVGDGKLKAIQSACPSNIDFVNLLTVCWKPSYAEFMDEYFFELQNIFKEFTLDIMRMRSTVKKIHLKVFFLT